MSGPQEHKGAVTRVAPGEVVITATPSATTTGTGQRIAASHLMTVVD